MLKLAIKEGLERKVKRLRTKDKELPRLIGRKARDILVDPYRFKPLREPLQNKRRVHARWIHEGHEEARRFFGFKG